MPTPLGYLTENSLTRYPFKDGSSLRPTGSGPPPLANDVFLDFQLTTTNSVALRVALTQLRVSSDGYGVNVSFVFTIFRFDPTKLVWLNSKFSFSRNASQISSHGLIAETSGLYTVKLVPGDGMIRLLGNSYGLVLNFVADPGSNLFAAELNPSTVIPMQPHVTHISFQNVKEAQPVFVPTLTGPITMQAGTNVAFAQDVDDVGMTVKAGIGTGLYNPCGALPTGVIKSINSIEGEDFVFVSGDCYRTVPLPDAHALKFEHICRPKCTNTEVNAFAYYANRVQDGINNMSDYVKGIVNTLAAQIAANEAAQSAQVVSPYIDTQAAKTLFNSRAYESICVGIYDPNKKKLSMNLDAYLSSGVVDSGYFEANPTWAGWVLYPGSAILHEDNNAYPLNITIPDTQDRVPLLSLRGIDCRGSALVNFIASIPSATSDQWAKLVLAAYEGDTLVGTAFKYQTLLPSPQPYFDVRARRGIRHGVTDTWVHTVTIELFDANPSWSGLTSFSAVISSGHTVKLPQLRINNGPAIALTTAGTTVTFSDQSVMYPDRAVVTFQLEAASAMVVNMTLTLTVGAQVVVLNNLTFS